MNLVAAPATLGRNLQRAVDQIAAENEGVQQVTHRAYSHHDEFAASSTLALGESVRLDLGAGIHIHP